MRGYRMVYLMKWVYISKYRSIDVGRACHPWSRHKIMFLLEGKEGQDMIGIDSNSPVEHALSQYAFCGKKKSNCIQFQS